MRCKPFLISNSFHFAFFCQVKVLVQWELHDQDDNVVFCFKSLVVIA